MTVISVWNSGGEERVIPRKMCRDDHVTHSRITGKQKILDPKI